MNRIVFDEDSESGRHGAAEAAVAGLESIMDDHSATPKTKRKRDDTSAAAGSPSKKKELSTERREERNLREKERSLKITQQIHELRNLLSSGGVIVPKGTKSTILTEAANYIRHLQQNQYQSEMDRAQLIQEVQRIGNGVIGDRAAVAIRHVANQNGVSKVANFGELKVASGNNPAQQTDTQDFMSDAIADHQYRCVFNSCSVGMAIATMGGSFIDCNAAFTKLSNYSKQELKATTIFNLTSREDLQGAFDMMSQLITPTNFGGNEAMNGAQPPVILRSAIRHRNDLGLSVSLIRGEDGCARYFNVTLVKLPSSLGLGNAKPVPATADMSPTNTEYARQPTDEQVMSKSACPQGMNLPSYTSG